MGCTVAITIILLLTYYGDNVGDFTVDVDDASFSSYGFSLCETEDFATPTSRLVAKSYEDANPIGNLTDYPNEILPEDIRRLIDSGLVGGGQNGDNFMAYTFYIQNSGTEIVDYKYAINIESVTNNLDAAIRVMVVQKRNVNYSEDDPIETIYAKRQGINGKEPGEAEMGTTPFTSQTVVLDQLELAISPGFIDKYTVIMWVEGHDEDATNVGPNSIVNGVIKLSMKFSLVK